MGGGVIMRRKIISKRGRLLPLLAACGLGYLIGALHLATLGEVGNSSAAQAVALRFPKEWAASPVIALAAVKNADADLFRPVPMAPAAQIEANADQPVIDHLTQEPEAPAPVPRVVQTASLAGAAAPTGNGLDPATRPVAGEAAKASAARAHTAAASRAGYILDDAQIASIKARLHLTPDQERMWPAVEAALRNMAYKRTQQAAAHGAARNLQAAAVDPQAVDGLKSAAVPLIMSFSSEQKEEVRNLAHVMGLDQLASQF